MAPAASRRGVKSALAVASGILLLAACASAAIQCRDEDGKDVDWYVVIKINDGMAYFYMDGNMSRFVKSSFNLTLPTGGAITNTLQRIYGNDLASYVLYNDEPPNRSSSSEFGHTKGVIGAEGGSTLTGFWLVHSTPRFPDLPSETSKYPGMHWNEHIYGQSFLCISFQGASSLDTIANALMLNHPDIYDFYLSASVQKASPTLDAVTSGKYSTDPVCDETTLSSANGQSFTVFAKSKEWNQDLYAACVAPKLQVQQLFVESWIRGYAIGPVCDPNYQVLDVEHVEFDGVSWKETQDHSKWAVDSDASVTCIGDINRMTSQYKRSGGTVCIRWPALNQQFLNAVTASNSC